MINRQFEIILKNKAALILISIFIASRIYLSFGFNSDYSDIIIYADYAFESSMAKNSGLDLYSYHEKKIEYEIKHDKNNSYSEIDKIIEYPPLAVKFMELPNFFIKINDQIPQQFIFDEYLNDYKFWYKIINLFIEIICFILLLKLIMDLYADSSQIEINLRILFFFFPGIILFNLLYDRLDLVMGVLIAVSIFFLLKNKNYILSYLFLVIGIEFKVIPVLLLPVFIISSLPSNFFNLLTDRKRIFYALILVLKRLILLFGALFIFTLLFFILYGEKSFKFMLFHSGRGIQIESLYSSIMMIVDSFYNINIHVTHGFGGFNLDSAIANILLPASTILVFISVLFLIFNFILILIKNLKTSRSGVDSEKTIAQKDPEIIIIFSFLFIALPMIFSKVFSPQYLLWLSPILAILPLKNKYLKLAPWIYLSACVFTLVIFPFIYFSDIALIDSAPTILGKTMIILKNFTFILFIISLILGVNKITDRMPNNY